MITRYKQNLRVEGDKVYSYNTHVATIRGGELVKHGSCTMTTSKHINYVAREYGLTVIEGKKEPEQDRTGEHLKAVGAVSALGGVFCKTPKEKNDWTKRMLSTVNGISFPDNFDTLPEDERTRRLDGALKEISPSA